jgi:hypothetical protein
MAHDKTTEEVTYIGQIKVAGMPPFDFSTKATSERKAKSNGIAQFARKCNLSIPTMNAQLKKTPHTVHAQQEAT